MKQLLSKHDVDFYKTQGYLLLENFFNQKTIKMATQAIQEILDNQPKNTLELESKDKEIIRRIWAPNQRHDFFAAMACDSKLLDAIESLIGENIILHFSRINMKAPRIGSPVEWHQDFSYHPHTNTDLVTCVIYLDDAHKDNGCLQVIPSSHTHGLYNHEKDGYFIGKVTNEYLPPHNTAVFLPAPAGSVIFIHSLTLHKSNVNQSDQPRRAFLPSYRAADSYPIYIGPHTGLHEPTTKVVRGKRSKIARVDPTARWPLPFAEKEFSSLYEIQEGSHLTNSARKNHGYFGQGLKE